MRSGRLFGQHRRFPRAYTDLPIAFSIGEEHLWQPGRLVDLSSGGLRISCSIELKQGTPIILTFSLPGRERKVFAQGVVAMSFFDGPSKQYSNGVAFTLIFKADKEGIAEYLNGALLGAPAS